MASPEHVEVLRAGVDSIRGWRKLHPDSHLDLRGADFSRSELSHVNLRFADLTNANLSDCLMRNADFSNADFSNADLTNADFSDSELRRARFIDARLGGANLQNADLSEAIIRRTILSKSDFTGSFLYHTNFSDCVLEATCFRKARFGDTSFNRVDLSKVTGLEEIVHKSASSIGLDTLYLSEGKIPDVFLRGCGVSEEMISYHQTLIGKAFEFFSCFISFTETDDDFSQRLYNDLQGAGIRCWRWKEDSRWGRTLMREVDSAVRVYDKLVVICSEDSLNAEPVIREIEGTLRRELREGKEILLPIRIDDSVFSWQHELQPDLMRKNIGDFRNWQDPTAYRESLTRLLVSLRQQDYRSANAGGGR